MSSENNQTDLPRVVDALWKSLGFTSRSAFWEAAGITNKTYWNKRLAGTVPTAKKHLDQLLDGLRQAGYSVTTQQEADLRTAVGMTVTIHDSSGPTEQRSQESLARFHAVLVDDNRFIHNRLSSFVGRNREIAEIRVHIAKVQPVGGYVTITGKAGQGKSSIIAKLIDEYDSKNVSCHFIPLNPGPDHQVSLLRKLMAVLILNYELSENYIDSENRSILRDHFSYVLAELSAKDVKEIIFIDGLDQLQEEMNGVRDLSFLPISPPPGIVFVLSTRPNETLIPLEFLKPCIEYSLPDLSRSDFDLILDRHEVQLDRILVNRFYEAMQGNALYLDILAKELIQIEIPDLETIIQRLVDNPNHIFSLAIERLKQRRQEWLEITKPILGLLLVAREPLHLRVMRDILHVDGGILRDGLQRLGGLISVNEGQYYSLYHLKLQEFLRENKNGNEKYVFDLEEEAQWHQRIVTWCEHERGGLQVIWRDVMEEPVEHGRRTYARRHYITHLYFSKNWTRLWEVLDQGVYGKAKLLMNFSTLSYVKDLDLGIQTTIQAERAYGNALILLPNLWRYSLLRCSLSHLADHYPDVLFEVLLLLGREKEAIELTELQTHKEREVRLLTQISVHLAQVQHRLQEAQQVLVRASAVAHKIEYQPSQADALYIVGKALIETGDQALAHLLLTEAAATAHTIPGEWVRQQALETANQILKQIKQRAMIETVVRAIPDPSKRAFALIAVSETLYQTDQLTSGLTLLDEATFAARTIPDARQRVEALQLVAQALTQRGQQSVAVTLLDEAVAAARTISVARQRAEALQLVAQALTQRGQQSGAVTLLDEAVAVARTIPDARQRAEALQLVAQAFVHAGRQSIVLPLISEITASVYAINDSSQHALMFNYLAQKFAEVGQGQEGLLVTKAINHSWQRAAAQVVIVQALCKSGQQDQAISITGMIEDPWQKAVSQVMVVKMLAEAGQQERATLLAQEIDKPAQRVEAFQELARMLIQVGQPDSALNVLEEATTAARAVESSSRRNAALKSVVESFVECGDLKKATAIAQTIEYPPQRDIALEAVALAFARMSQRPPTLDMLQEATIIARTIESMNRRAKALRGVAEALAHTQHAEEAIEVAQTIELSWERDQTLKIIAQTLAEMGDITLAITIVRSFESPKERSAAFQWLAQTLAQKGQQSKSLSLLHEANIVVQTNQDSLQYIDVIQGIADVYAQLGQAEQAVTIAGTIRNTEQQAKALLTVTQSLAEQGQGEQAATVAHMIDNSRQRAEALGFAARALALSGEQSAALTILKEAIDTIHTIEIDDLERRVPVFESVSHAFAQPGKAEQAVIIARMIRNPGQRAKALLTVTQSLAEQGQGEQAATVARMIESPQQLVEALGFASQGLVLSEQQSTMLDIVEEAINIIRIINNKYDRLFAIAGIAQALARIGRQEVILRLLNEVQATTVVSRNSYLEDVISGSIARGLAWAGQWLQIEETGLYNKTHYWRIEDLQSIIHALVQEKKQIIAFDLIDRAIANARRMREIGQRALALGKIAHALIQLEQMSKAYAILDEATIATRTIGGTTQCAEVLQIIAQALHKLGEHARLLRLIQQSWSHAHTRDYILQLLPMASGLIVDKPELGFAFIEALDWVDDFLET